METSNRFAPPGALVDDVVAGQGRRFHRHRPHGLGTIAAIAVSALFLGGVPGTPSGR